MANTNQGALDTSTAGISAVVGVGSTDWVQDYRRVRNGEKPHDSYGYATLAFKRAAGRAEGAYPVKAFVADVGRHRPLNVGGGAVALLSGLPDDEIERILRNNAERLARDYPRFSAQVMWERIRQVREQGYLVSEVLEVQEIHTLAKPIFGPHGAPVGALSVSGLRKRMSGGYLKEKIEVITKAVHEVEAALHSDGKE